MRRNNGFGIGLRPVHYEDILNTLPDIDWFEIITEDFLIDHGRPLDYLSAICEHYPVAMHGVSLSIGSCDPLNWDYLKRVKQLKERIHPMWISDHLCWTGINGINLHDLMPIPYTKESIHHLVPRIQQVQDYLGCQILLENVSSYIAHRDSEMSEWEFLSAVAKESNCLILLDINNIYVNAYNHNFDPKEYLKGITAERVLQFHIAGHKNCQTHIIDTHGASIVDAVWELYGDAVQLFNQAATLIERDSDIPPLDTLLEELEKAKSIYQKQNNLPNSAELKNSN